MAAVCVFIDILCSQGRRTGRERVAVVAQLVEQVAFYRLTRRGDVDAENPGGVLAEDLVLHLGRQLRVMCWAASSSGIVKVWKASICQCGGPITGVSVPHRM